MARAPEFCTGCGPRLVVGTASSSASSSVRNIQRAWWRAGRRMGLGTALSAAAAGPCSPHGRGAGLGLPVRAVLGGLADAAVSHSAGK